MNRASNYIELSEKQSGVMIGCIEEAAFQSGFIDKANLLEITKSMPESGYKNYLLDFQNIYENFVTGGSGFIGTNFVNLALKDGHKIFNVDNLKLFKKIGI